MTRTPQPRRRDPHRAELFRAARNGFLWFAALWLLFRNAFRRARTWTVERVKNLARSRPVTAGAVAGVAAMVTGLVVYAALSDKGYHPHLFPAVPTSAASSSGHPRPGPSPPPSVPGPPPVPASPPAPPPITPRTPAPTHAPEPAPQPATPTPFSTPSGVPVTQPILAPAPTPAPTPAPSPTAAPIAQTCLLRPDGDRCLNPKGLVRNSKTPPGQTR